MLRKVMAVVLLGFLGLAAGVTLGVLFPRYDVSDMLLLPAHSPHSASELVRMTRHDYPGVSVVAYGERHIAFSAAGSSGSANRAVSLANREVIAANDGTVKKVLSAAPFLPLSPDIDGLKGLLAGFGTALGFLMPPRSRTRSAA